MSSHSDQSPSPSHHPNYRQNFGGQTPYTPDFNKTHVNRLTSWSTNAWASREFSNINRRARYLMKYRAIFCRDMLFKASRWFEIQCYCATLYIHASHGLCPGLSNTIVGPNFVKLPKVSSIAFNRLYNMLLANVILLLVWLFYEIGQPTLGRNNCWDLNSFN